MSNSFDETARFTLMSKVLVISVGLPMFIIGITGNLLNSLMFAYLPQLNKLSSSIFLLISFTSSEIVLLTGLLSELVYRISGIDPLVSYVILCKFRWFLGSSCGTVALHYICFAAINQYLVTSHTIRFHRLIPRRRSLFLSIIILFYVFGLLSPSMIFYTHVVSSTNVTTCGVVNPMYAVYIAYFSIVIYSLIPIFILSIFSYLTWKNVHSNVIRHRSLKQTLTRMLLTQIVMILVTSIPNVINQMYFFYTRTTQKSSLRLAEESLVSTIFTLIGFSTHSLSFYVYITISKTFRQNIRFLFLRRQHRIQPAILP